MELDCNLRINAVDFSECAVGRIEKARERALDICEHWEELERIDEIVRDECGRRGLASGRYIRAELKFGATECDVQMECYKECWGEVDKILMHIVVDLQAAEAVVFESFCRDI